MSNNSSARRKFQLSIATLVVFVGVTATLPFYILLYSNHLWEVGQYSRQAVELNSIDAGAVARSQETVRAHATRSLRRTVIGAVFAFGISLSLLMLLAWRLRAQLDAVARGSIENKGRASVISEFVEIGGALASARAEAQEGALELERAQFDQLTGLPGRALFFRQAEAQVEAARKMKNGAVALLYIDLDKFKSINDKRGHLSGDIILKQVGARLRECVRAPDAVGRVGGDEFVVCFSAPLDMIEQLAEGATNRITKAISGIDPDIGCSVGWALSGSPCDLNDLISEADAAMYLAKQTRKSAYSASG